MQRDPWMVASWALLHPGHGHILRDPAGPRTPHGGGLFTWHVRGGWPGPPTHPNIPENVLRTPPVSSSPSRCIQDAAWTDRWTDRPGALLSCIPSLRAPNWVLQSSASVLPNLQSNAVAIHHGQMKPVPNPEPVAR